MKRRVSLLFVLPMVMLAVMATAPYSAFAATSTSSSVKPHIMPHILLHSGKNSTTKGAVIPAASNLIYHNPGPVMGGTAHVYAIFWEPTGSVSSSYNSLIERYFNDVSGTGLYNNNKQYTSSVLPSPPTATVLSGAFVDTSSYPESPLLDSDIQNEVSFAQAVNGWSSSITNIFFVFLESNQDLCFDSSFTQCASNAFCAYHSFFGTNTIYAAMPYAASFSCDPGGSTPNDHDADLTINVSSHEQMEAATDPLLNAWFDSSGQEIGDKCAWNFGARGSDGGNITLHTDRYLVQKEWDNHVSGCVLSGP